MNNIDEMTTAVKPKITIVKKPKDKTVAQIFADLEDEVFTADLAAQLYDGSHHVLSAVTKAVAATAAKNAAFETDAPTISFGAKRQKDFALEWWTYLTEEVEGGPEGSDKALRKALDLDVKQTFDAVFYKIISGKELPKAKDGFERNAMKILRKETGHGDATIFLFRLRYWWPKATIVIDGRKWIANTHKQWAEELGMEERGFRTAYNHLLKMELLEARAAPFKGQTMNHVRPTEICQKLFARFEK